METSDSEYYESADEDVQSEDDSIVSSKIPQKLDSKQEKGGNELIGVASRIDKLDLEPSKTDKNNTKKDDKHLSKQLDEPDKQMGKKSISTILENENINKEIDQKTEYPLTKSEDNKENKSNNKVDLDQNSSNKPEPSSEKAEICGTKFDSNTEKTSPNDDRQVKENISGKPTPSVESDKREKQVETENFSTEKPAVDVQPSLKSKEPVENLWDDDEFNWDQQNKETNDKSFDSSKKTIEKMEEGDDNLWNDDELDWEAEGQLEAAQQKDALKKEIEEENSWQNDDWVPVEKPNEIPECKPQTEASSGWEGWNSWGVTSLLNTATQGVSTLTSHISTVMEGGMGIPNPEEMARENNQSNPEGSEDSPQLFGLGNLVGSVSHITKFVESTSTKVITGGLDTLETIGKKTMEVLQEGDPGLKKKRAFLKLDTGKPVLSQVLREAKEKAENDKTVIKCRNVKSYETLFDDYHGLVHLEALEMLSKLSNMKLQSFKDSLSGEALKDMQETMDQVKELCELPEEDEDQQLTLAEIKEKIDSAIEELDYCIIAYDKLIKHCEETEFWISTLRPFFTSEEELHQKAIDSLAKTTALAVEQFHKIGEHLLVKEHRSTAGEADSLVQLTIVIKSLILRQAKIVTRKLRSLEHLDEIRYKEMITNIFFEAANSSSYIEDAFQLLVPVLQVGAV